jgi:hypothetical protein
LGVVQAAREFCVGGLTVGGVEVAEHEQVVAGCQLGIDLVADRADLSVAANRLDVGHQADLVDAGQVRVSDQDGDRRLVGRCDHGAQHAGLFAELVLQDRETAEQTQVGCAGSG